MQTAEKPLSDFLFENADRILELAEKEGFLFSARESKRSVTVRCTLPDGHARFIVFEDHRVENPHGEKPHVCNQWHKALGNPLSYTAGKDVSSVLTLRKALRAAAIMCLTQSDAYTKIKNDIFEQ